MESEEKYRKVYNALLKRCSHIEEFNERLSYRLLQSKRVLNRLRRQRQFLVKRLDDYHDKYDDAGVLLEERKKHIERLLGRRGDIVDITDGTTSEEEAERKLKKGHHKFANHLNSKSIIKKYKLKGYVKQEKERDPNAPKKPANAFFHFCQENRNLYQDAQKEGDTSGHHDLTKFLGNKWNSLEKSDKKVYYEMYEKDKKRYEEELKIYNSKKADEEVGKLSALSPNSKENVGEIKIKEEEIMYDVDDSKAEFQSLSNDDQDTRMEISMNNGSEHTSFNGDDTNNLNIDSEEDYNTTNDVDNDYQELVDNECDLESEQLNDNCEMIEDDDDQNDS